MQCIFFICLNLSQWKNVVTFILLWIIFSSAWIYKNVPNIRIFCHMFWPIKLKIILSNKQIIMLSFKWTPCSSKLFLENKVSLKLITSDQILNGRVDLKLLSPPSYLYNTYVVDSKVGAGGEKGGCILHPVGLLSAFLVVILVSISDNWAEEEAFTKFIDDLKKLLMK